MVIRILLSGTICTALFCLGSCREDKSKFPPDKLLTAAEQDSLVLKFVEEYQLESTKEHLKMNEAEYKENLSMVFKLRNAYVKDSSFYFMIVENRLLFPPGPHGIYYGGVLSRVKGEMIFNAKFDIEVHDRTGADSLDRLFELMINDSLPQYIQLRHLQNRR